MLSSFDVYQEAYDKALISEAFTDDELELFLLSNFIWSKEDEARLETLKKNIDDLKLYSYKNFYKKKELGSIKRMIRETEDRLNALQNKKVQYNHLSCSGIATNAQWLWLIERSTFFSTGQLYNWDEVSISDIFRYYESNTISLADIRKVARLGQWRQTWAIGKKVGNLFSRPAVEFTRDQTTLCALSLMYDNVYESPDSPAEDIIQDDDALDGWFIDQKNKNDEMKKESSAKTITNNEKIANSKQIYVVAQSPEEANHVYNMNTKEADDIRKQRAETLRKKGVINSELEFEDVRAELIMDKNRRSTEKK